MCLAIARPVHWVASPGGSAQIGLTTRRTIASPKGALPGLRVASRSSPAIRASAKRRCQRQTAGRPTPARRATAATFSRSAEPQKDPSPRHVLLGAVAIATIASRRARSSAETRGQTV